MAHPHPDQAPTPGWPTRRYLPDRIVIELGEQT